MTISSAVWDKYVAGLRKVNVAAANQFSSFMLARLPVTPAVQNELIDYAYALATKYGEAAAELAAQMYDAVAAASGLVLEPAVPAATATMHEAAKTVVGTLKTGNTDIVADAVGRLVKQAGVDTTVQNALRDGAQCAWIPRGDTCAFCIALASNGWQDASRRVLKGNHAEHIHANCDCTFAIRFDMDTDVEGYDPDRYEEMYLYELDENGNVRLDEDGDPIRRDETSPTARINAMRRDFYTANRARIERQNVSDEVKRIELNAPAAEQTTV